MSNQAYLTTKPSLPATSTIAMEEIVAKGTIASFPDGVGKITKHTGCFVAIKPLVFELRSEGHFKLDDSQTVRPISEDPRLT